MISKKLKQYLTQDVCFNKILETKIFSVCMTLSKDVSFNYIYESNNTSTSKDVLDSGDEQRILQAILTHLIPVDCFLSKIILSKYC